MNASRDENRVTSLIGVLNTDGITTITAYVDPTTHVLNVSDGVDGSNYGKQAIRDENHIPVAMAVSSVDGQTLVPIYLDSSHKLLIQKT